MTEELRLVLLATGILIIAFIAWDANRRKKNNQPDSSFKKVQQTTLSEGENFDTDGYNELGVTRVRVLGGSKDEATASINETLNQTLNHTTNEDLTERLEPSFADDLDNETDAVDSPQDEKPTEILPNEADEIFASSNIETLQKPETVITINLMAPEDAPFQGNILLQELLTLGFKYGDMGIFHRYQHANGQGERWFCLANAFNPGNFDLDNMQDFTTSGLTIFMLLPGPQNPLEAFDNMLNAADKLRTVLGGKLEDGSHSALSQQRIQMYQEEIKQFQRTQQLSSDPHND